MPKRPLEAAGIIANKNGIPNDPRPPKVTSGMRLGTPALTTRGLKENDITHVADFLDRAIPRPNMIHRRHLLQLRDRPRVQFLRPTRQTLQPLAQSPAAQLTVHHQIRRRRQTNHRLHPRLLPRNRCRQANQVSSRRVPQQHDSIWIPSIMPRMHLRPSNRSLHILQTIRPPILRRQPIIDAKGRKPRISQRLNKRVKFMRLIPTRPPTPVHQNHNRKRTLPPRHARWPRTSNPAPKITPSGIST
jgi:hypothetical protein